MKVVDADAHVVENEATWNFIDPECRAMRPVPLVFEENSVHGLYSRFNAVWLIDGKVIPKAAGRGIHVLSTPPRSLAARSNRLTSIPARDMSDVPARLADMDRLGIHYQVVFPTLFLVTVADDIQVERALCQSYNRFMGQACSQSDGRIRFGAVVPWRNMEHAIQLLREAKELGAVAVMVPGLMWDNPLSDASFFPLYEEACRLQLPLVVHVAWSSPSLNGIFSDLPNANFSSLVLPVMMGFWALMIHGVHDRFPELKVAFLEAGCEWLPYTMTQLKRCYERGLTQMNHEPAEYLRRGNIYVACEPDEDIAMVLNHIGENQLVTGSDYGHADQSVEENIVHAMEEEQPGLLPSVREKILSANPLRLYNLPA